MIGSEVWKSLFEKVKVNLPSKYQKALKVIFENGSLSTRILKAMGDDFSEKNILKVYEELGNCLQENKLFLP